MIVRDCVRALIEEPSGRFLLMRIVEPSSGNAFWITPGGGKERDESDDLALARELKEETGLDSFSPGPLIWTRDFTFDWLGETYRQYERFYWLRVPYWHAGPVALSGDIEARSFDALRWWTLDEIDASPEVFAPLDLASHIRGLRADGPPTPPTVLGP